MKKLILIFWIGFELLQTLRILNAQNPFFDCFWGHYAYFNKDYQTAEEYFQKILKNHTSLGLKGCISLLFEQQEFKKIISLEKKIERYCEDAATQLLFIKSLEFLGKPEKAEKKLIELSKHFKDHQEIMYGAAISCMRSNNTQAALNIIDTYLQSNTFERPTDFIFYFLKAQIFFALNQYTQAKEYIEKLLQINPHFEQGWLLSALVYELSGDIDQAINGYKQFLSISGKQDLNIEQQIMNLTIQKKCNTPIKPKSIQEHLNSALFLYQSHKFEKSLEQLELCIKQDPTCKTALLLKIEILCQMGRSSQALTFIKQIIQVRPEEQEWYRCLYILYHIGNMEKEIIKTLEELQNISPNNLFATLYLADIYLKQQNNVNALSYLDKAHKLAKTYQLQTRIDYQRAKIYYQEKNFIQLKDILSKIDQHTYVYVPLYNLAAYFYATKENNLVKAQLLINKALKVNKNNIHCLDTQAFIWYKKGDFKKALDLLYKLSNKYPDDPFIKKHLAKALHKLGNTTLAQQKI